jgi:ElaB/YqjD/DUF883 family membrane-anchored ribosome-binding protein
MTIAATGIEDSIGAFPLTSGSIDEVQDLIGRTEEILDTLKELGDTSYDRLRLKLNENVNVVREKLLDGVGRPENGRIGGYRAPTFTVATLIVATLSGFVIGLLVARLRSFD